MKTPSNSFVGMLSKVEVRKYFNFIVTRVVPDKFLLPRKLDRAALSVLSPLAHVLAGRVLVAGVIDTDTTDH